MSKCYRFPKEEVFCESWNSHFSNQYLAEKTCPTAKKWLAGKKVHNFDLVTTYALYDYHQKVCQDKNVCTAVKMNYEFDFGEIQKALHDMAEECPCD